MPIDFADLSPSFRPLAEELLARCTADGKPMEAYFGVRDPSTQARLYRQSRPWSKIEVAIRNLVNAGAPFLAQVLEGVGPQSGKWATNAVPGNSWHQFTEAIDSVAIVDGIWSWDTEPGEAGGRGDEHYANYAKRAGELGLTSLARIGDWVHVQERPESAPYKVFAWPEIDARMRERFAG